MPFTYGFTGWVTNWLALEMTFYPLEFKGFFPPYLGWQGIIPRKGYKMAGIYVDVITERLLTIEEIVARIKPEEISERLKEQIEPLIDEVVDEVGVRLYPDIWRMMPEMIKNQINSQAKSEVPETMRKVYEEVRERIEQIFDIKEFVYLNLTGKNIFLLVDMFQRVGAPEFKFIRNSGLYFGMALGMIQFVIYYFFPIWWTLPIQGVIVGYLTNWLALQMIFRPLREKKYGFLKYQGLFLKRQEEVSREFSNLVSTRILSSRKILNHILFGETADIILNIVQQNTSKAFDRTAGYSRPILVLSAGNEKYEETRTFITNRVETILNEQYTDGLAEYMDQAMGLEETMAKRMAALEPEEFEYLLRTAFKEDELLLILVGALLGAVIGGIQGLAMLFFG